jgi:hypothetical protein
MLIRPLDRGLLRPPMGANRRAERGIGLISQSFSPFFAAREGSTRFPHQSQALPRKERHGGGPVRPQPAGLALNR